MDKELLQFMTAIALRRIAQLKYRSIFNAPDIKSKDITSIYEISGELCKDFKDVFLQEASELAQTSADDKNLSPVKIALMLAEAIPLNVGYSDIKDNYPDKAEITSKVLSIKAGHPAEKFEHYFAFGSGKSDANSFMPVEERMLTKPLESDMSDLYEIVFNDAKALINQLNLPNFNQTINQLIEMLMPLPIQLADESLISMGSYLRVVLIIGCSIYSEIKAHGPGVMQSDDNNLWAITKIEIEKLGINGNLKGSFIDNSKEFKVLRKELFDALKSDALMIENHEIKSTLPNHIYLLHNKSLVEELSRKIKPAITHWHAQNRAVVGVASIELNKNELSDNEKFEICLKKVNSHAHQEIVRKIALNSASQPVKGKSKAENPKKTSKINAPELVQKSTSDVRNPVLGMLLIKQESQPELILNSDAGLPLILFANDRFNHFWEKIVPEIVVKYRFLSSMIHLEKGEIVIKNKMPRLLSFTREFFSLYHEFGMPVSISASITMNLEGDDDGNLSMALQGFGNAKNLIRPKIRSEIQNINPFSGFKGSALALGLLEQKSKSTIPSEDLKIFFEMMRQIASLAGYRVSSDDIVPLSSQIKPEIFNILHSITNKIKSDKDFNWQSVLYYMLTEKFSDEADSNVKNLTEQAINNLLLTLRYNRWQNIQRLMSRPAHIYMNILAKWLKVLELT
ncbi:MAG: hypothetical protein K8S87_05155 [Planctomycetes bacterium]|nr:hypothetical protein [Planctomycetota bacterium]